MTVPALPIFSVFLGTGSIGPFTFAFPFLDNSEITAIVTDPLGNTTTAIVASLTGALTDTGGSLTLVNPLLAGYTLTITRILPIEQQIELPDGGPFFATTIEAALDYLTMICQQLVTQIAAIVTIKTAVGMITYVEGDATLGIYTIQYAGNGELVAWKKDATANVVKVLPPAGWTIAGQTEYDLYLQGESARFFPSSTSNNLVKV